MSLCVFDSKVMKEQTAPFIDFLEPVTFPLWIATRKHRVTLPLIPVELFRKIVSWQRKIATDHRCETTTSLFLVDGVWHAVPFYQNNNHGSMVADVDYVDDERNKALLDQWADKSDVHATLHNHVFAAAGQSGRDADDEKKLPGPHITIGNLDRETMTFHARMSTLVDGKHLFIELKLADIIDVGLPEAPISETAMLEIERAHLTFPQNDALIPQEWADRFEVKKAVPKTHAQPSRYSGGQQYDTAESMLLEHCDTIGLWPYDMLGSLNLTTLEAFTKSLENLSPMGKHAALAVANVISGTEQPTVAQLLAHLQQRKLEIKS